MWSTHPLRWHNETRFTTFACGWFVCQKFTMASPHWNIDHSIAWTRYFSRSLIALSCDSTESLITLSCDLTQSFITLSSLLAVCLICYPKFRPFRIRIRSSRCLVIMGHPFRCISAKLCLTMSLTSTAVTPNWYSSTDCTTWRHL